MHGKAEFAVEERTKGEGGEGERERGKEVDKTTPKLEVFNGRREIFDLSVEREPESEVGEIRGKARKSGVEFVAKREVR